MCNREKNSNAVNFNYTIIVIYDTRVVMTIKMPILRL